MNLELAIDASSAMIDRGGSFVRTIGKAFVFADTSNKKRLLNAFGNIFEKYGYYTQEAPKKISRTRNNAERFSFLKKALNDEIQIIELISLNNIKKNNESVMDYLFELPTFSYKFEDENDPIELILIHKITSNKYRCYCMNNNETYLIDWDNVPIERLAQFHDAFEYEPF